MKYKFFFSILCLSVILIAYMTHNINEYMGNRLELKEINFDPTKCYIIGNETSYEDIVKINDNYLIGSQYKTFDFYTPRSYLTKNTENDNLYLINIISQTAIPIKISNFPQNVPFHPHGLDIFQIENNKFLLYVVNHAINFNYVGEERIEIMKVIYNIKKEINLIYEKSIILPKNYFLTVNSIAIESKDVFYLTTHSPFTSPNSPKEFSFPFKIKYILFGYLKSLFYMLNIKKCYVYKYIISKKQIDLIPNSQSLFNNGIAFDKTRNFIYVIKTMEKEMNIFITKNNKVDLIKTIPTLYIGDNIFYDKENDKIYIGFAGQFNENFAIKSAYKKYGNFDGVTAYSGYEIISPDSGYSISELVVMKNNFRGVSSAIKIGKNVYMSSIYSKGIYICSSEDS